MLLFALLALKVNFSLLELPVVAVVARSWDRPKRAVVTVVVLLLRLNVNQLLKLAVVFVVRAEDKVVLIHQELYEGIDR